MSSSSSSLNVAATVDQQECTDDVVPQGSRPLSRKERLAIWREQKRSMTTGFAVNNQSHASSKKPISVWVDKENVSHSSVSSGSRTEKSRPALSLKQPSAASKDSSASTPSDTVSADDYNNLKSKYRNLQALHKLKLELLAGTGQKLNEAMAEIASKSETIKSLKRQLESSLLKHSNDINALKVEVKEKDDLLMAFASDYVPRTDFEELEERLEVYQQEEEESREIIQILKAELENAFDSTVADKKEVEEQLEMSKQDELDAVMMQHKRDLAWKDQEINQLKDALLDTLRENANLHEVTKEPAKNETTEISTQIFVTETKEIAVQTELDFPALIKQAKIMAREFQNIKTGNDLMYQQLCEIQKKSHVKCEALRKDIRALTRDREEYLDLNAQLMNFQQEREQVILEMKRENEELRKSKSTNTVSNSNNNDDIYSQAFAQAEQMAMMQIQEMMEKYELCEQELEKERKKCTDMEDELKSLLAAGESID